jgi:thiamine kinase-like enzyme
MRVKQLEHFMGEGWQLRPAGGATGEAYIAEQGEQKIFIKRNSSPFLAVLSAEGIVPKLLWTKRLENGDVITAQRWVDGHELKAAEMNDTRVASLLSKIHQSKDLLHMFKRMGNLALTPEHLLSKLVHKRECVNFEDATITEAFKWLLENVPPFSEENYVVCHADINHNNWMSNGENHLYLIDWDCAQVADPALDLAPLLYIYIPKTTWPTWLKIYGVDMSVDLLSRMRWYMIVECIDNILWYRGRNEPREALKWSGQLKDVLKERD